MAPWFRRGAIAAGTIALSHIAMQKWLDSFDRRLPLAENSTRIDNTFYGFVDWWGEQSAFYLLKKMNSVRVPYFAKHLEFSTSGKTILDIGCGGGLVTEELAKAGFDMTGLDHSEGALKTARDHAKLTKTQNINYIQGSAYKLPFPDQSFDGVVISDVLEHLVDLKKVLIEIQRVLKPGGVMVFDTINRTVFSTVVIWFFGQEIFQVVPSKAHDYKLFIKPEELMDLLVGTGFELPLAPKIAVQQEYTKAGSTMPKATDKLSQEDVKKMSGNQPSSESTSESINQTKTHRQDDPLGSVVSEIVSNIGQAVDKRSMPLSTVVVPESWKGIVQDLSITKLFTSFSIRNAVTGFHESNVDFAGSYMGYVIRK